MSLSWDLWWAVQKGDDSKVEILLSEGVDVNERFVDGWTALHWAAWKGLRGVVEALVTHGADTQCKNDPPASKTPLDLASSAEIVRSIHRGLLWRAVKQGNVTEIERVLPQCDVNDKDVIHGNSALHLAARYGQSDVIKKLVEKKADPNATTMGGTVPLHTAAKYGHVAALELLLAGRADVDAASKEGWSALHLAAGSGHTDIVDRLLSAHCDVNARNEGGWSALHWAANNGHEVIADMLLRSGADVNIQNKGGKTALHKAAWFGHRDVIDLLVAGKADVDIQESNGYTALHFAACNGHKDVVIALLRKGARADLRHRDGRTALHLAAHNGHADIVDALVRRMPDVNVTTNDGDTPLHDAARNGHVDAVERLLAHKADIRATNSTRNTPRQLAKSHEVRRILDRALTMAKMDEQVPVDRVKLFLCGHGGVGKSTLARALPRSAIAEALFNLPHASSHRTHGFDAFPATVPGAGDCTIWDFGGQTEHWVPHGIFMQTASGVFLVVCNLSDHVDVQREQLKYWMRFIASRAQPEAKPRVALVGTHRGAAKVMRARLKTRRAEIGRREHDATSARIARLDAIRDMGGRWMSLAVEENVSSLHEEFADLLDLAPRIFYVDSVSMTRTDRSEMHRLRQWLAAMFENVRATRPVPKACLDVARLLRAARKELPVVAPFNAVRRVVQMAGGEKIDLTDEDRFRAVLGHLSKAGHVMYFEDVDDAVVVDPQAFGEHVIGQLFCPAGTLIISKHDHYLFRQSSLKKVLSRVGLDPSSVGLVLDILIDLELVFSWNDDEGADAGADDDDAAAAARAREDPLYSVPGRLSHIACEEGAVVDYSRRPRDCWAEPSLDTADRWHYLGVRLEITNSQLMISPSSFPRLQSRLSKHSGFRMWRNGARTCTTTVTGHTEIESLIELHNSLQWIDVCVRSQMGSEKKCVQLLLEMVSMCERLGAQLRATVISVDAVRAGDVERLVDRSGAVQQSEDDARRHLPSQWLREQFAHILQPAGVLPRAASGASRGLHPLYFERPPPSDRVIVISYSTKQRDCMWQVARSLSEAGYLVFNGDQIKPGEEWDKVYFDTYLEPCKVGLVMLSDSFFASKNCCDELKSMYNENKAIVPIKVATFGKPPLQYGRMLGNHIPNTLGTSPDTFSDTFEANMRLLIKALDKALFEMGVAKTIRKPHGL